MQTTFFLSVLILEVFIHFLTLGTSIIKEDASIRLGLDPRRVRVIHITVFGLRILTHWKVFIGDNTESCHRLRGQCHPLEHLREHPPEALLEGVPLFAEIGPWWLAGFVSFFTADLLVSG